jgi:hypothetical protein
MFLQLLFWIADRMDKHDESPDVFTWVRRV